MILQKCPASDQLGWVVGGCASLLGAVRVDGNDAFRGEQEMMKTNSPFELMSEEAAGTTGGATAVSNAATSMASSIAPSIPASDLQLSNSSTGPANTNFAGLLSLQRQGVQIKLEHQNDQTKSKRSTEPAKPGSTTATAAAAAAAAARLMMTQQAAASMSASPPTGAATSEPPPSTTQGDASADMLTDLSLQHHVLQVGVSECHACLP